MLHRIGPCPLRNGVILRFYSTCTKPCAGTQDKPKVLVAIHGYPRRYNAGSEVYTQTLALGLAEKGVEVNVFAREEDPFAPDYRVRVEHDPINPDVPVYLVNHARSNIRYSNAGIDTAFKTVLEKTRPDIVHMGHLNHLSTGMVRAARDHGASVVFTLHDFWLMCPRGQFLETGLDPCHPWKLCNGQDDLKCATRCLNRFHSGDPSSESQDVQYWTSWVGGRMRATREASRLVDLFVSPSTHLMQRFTSEFMPQNHKIICVDYGFDLKRLQGRIRPTNPDNIYTFGYIGRHHPSKGIDMLIDAFSRIEGRAKLIVWGRPEGQLTNTLKNLASSLIKPDSGKEIEWRSEYHNEYIVRDVFNHCDAIVVPSIWDENSPLVIHEAQQLRVPVITANHAAMAEFVVDGVNGLTFEHRNTHSLATCLQAAIDGPDRVQQLGSRGYLKSQDGNIPSIDEHINTLLGEYKSLLSQKNRNDVSKMGEIAQKINDVKPPKLDHLGSPWRITFDTNPDDCNLNCIMCEEHSPYSKSQKMRKEAGLRRRRMDIDTIRQVIAECAPKGLKEIIPSTMGEPLMYKHFPEIIELCSKYNIKMNLTTNGTFPGLGVAEWSHMIIPVASDVKFSWNGATGITQQEVMKGSRMDKQMANLREFISIRDHIMAKGGNRCSVTLQLTFMEINLKEIPQIVRMAIELGVDRVKGHHLWAHFDEIKSQNMRRDEASIARWNAIARECISIAENNPLPSGKKIVLENIYELNSNATKEIHPQAVCPFLGKEAWVNHEGRFDPCCAPDKERQTLGSFGNVKEGGLLRIWNSTPYSNLLNTYHQNSLCKGCNMRKPPTL